MNMGDSEDFRATDSGIVNSDKNMSSSDYLVAFSGNTERYYVGLVDMVDSTRIAATIGNEKISTYYQIFLNSMSRILSGFGGFVIKNVGDCLVYYFPESAKSNRKYGFMPCLECSLSMIEHHDAICKKLNIEGLPNVDYRISADYGSVVLNEIKQFYVHRHDWTACQYVLKDKPCCCKKWCIDRRGPLFHGTQIWRLQIQGSKRVITRIQALIPNIRDTQEMICMMESF